MDIQHAARFALAELEKTGAQQVYALVRQSKRSEFEAEHGQFSLLRSTFDNALTLTLIKDGKRGQVSGNDLSEQAIQAAVADCLAGADSAQPDDAWQLYPGDKRHFHQGLPEGDMDKLFTRAQELLADIGREHPKVMVESLSVVHMASHSLYLNNLGADYESQAGCYSISLMVNAHEGDKTSSFNGAGLSTLDLSKRFIDQGGLRLVLSDIEKQVDTQVTQGKHVGSVVFTPDCAGEVLGALIDNFMGDGVLLDGTSPWKDKLNQRMADPRLTISFSPHHDSVVLGENYMQDGRLSQDYDIIQAGVLKQFDLSSYVANKIKGRAAPNSGSGMVVAPGDTPLKDIIAGIDKGLLVARFSGGSPAGNGDFSGIAKNSFLIENGRIGPAVSETMISGNLADMVKHLRGISSERLSDGHSLLPWLAVDGITISGK